MLSEIYVFIIQLLKCFSQYPLKIKVFLINKRSIYPLASQYPVLSVLTNSLYFFSVYLSNTWEQNLLTFSAADYIATVDGEHSRILAAAHGRFSAVTRIPSRHSSASHNHFQPLWNILLLLPLGQTSFSPPFFGQCIRSSLRRLCWHRVLSVQT